LFINLTYSVSESLLLTTNPELCTHTQPFYSSLDFVRNNPGELVPDGTFCHLLDFLVHNEDTTGRCTNNPGGLSPIQTNWCPTIFMPDVLPGTTLQFILSWDRAMQ